MITHIIWDYNGTVVDDTAMSVAAVNAMLRSRGLCETDIDTYRATLCLPLGDYYRSIGITDKEMSQLSVEFRSYCSHYENLTRIFPDFNKVAKLLSEHGMKNILMSSLYSEFLADEVAKYNIADYFDDIIGLKDTSVGSKLSNAREYLTANRLNPSTVLFIGDLVTDARMAKELNAMCLLIPNGHNSEKRCACEGVPVAKRLIDVLTFCGIKNE